MGSNQVETLIEALKEPSCVFCNLLQQKSSNLRSLNEQYMILTDLNPLDEVHILIIPKYHIDSYLTETNDTDVNRGSDISIKQLKRKCRAEILELAQEEILKRGLKSANVSFNFKAPYAKVNHAHLHVIGFKTKCLNTSHRT